jgi:uncharacterized YccA/Bax inhibitor family protein
MKSSNPVLNRLAAAPQYQGPGAAAGYAGQPGPAQAPQYDYSPAQAPTTGVEVMTLDDVVVKTITLIGTTVAAAALTWILVPAPALGLVMIAGMVIGLILGLVISFAQVTNPAVLLTYAVAEGAFLGAISKAFESRFNGIVLQAVVATLSVFLVMAILYKMRVVRATPKFTKIVIGAAVGLVIAMVVNLLIGLFSDGAGPLRDGGPMAIVFSLICIVVAALMFVISFAQIEEGIAAGLPRKYGWLGAFGILVELVWLYLEFLRLISYFSEE